MTCLRARTSDQRGAAAVEFGLVAVILLTLMIGIIQFSIWFWAYQVGAHAAREGARYAAVHPCDPGGIQSLIVTRIGSAASGLPTTSPPTVTNGPANSAPATEVGDQITVEVTFSTHVIGGLLPALPAITKSATSRIEYVGGCP